MFLFVFSRGQRSTTQIFLNWKNVLLLQLCYLCNYTSKLNHYTFLIYLMSQIHDILKRMFYCSFYCHYAVDMYMLKKIHYCTVCVTLFIRWTTWSWSKLWLCSGLMWRSTTTWEKRLDSSPPAPAKVREREMKRMEKRALNCDEMGWGVRRYTEDELKEEKQEANKE